MKHSPVFFLTALLFTVLAGNFSCRPDSIVGVYGGVLMRANLLNSTLDRKDVVLYLRKDGTFTDKLKESDWKTNVTGKYIVSGLTLKLVYNEKNRVEEYEIVSKGNLKKDGTLFVKMNNGNEVPEGTYRFKGARSSGGTGTGQHYVGTSWTSTYYFDGKNKFSLSGKSGTNIIGGNAGGGSKSQNNDGGTYKLEDGMLTLNFSNGRSRTHSFFATKDAGTGKISAVIDGRFFFSDEIKDTTAPATDSIAIPGDANVNTTVPGADVIFNALKAAQGGDAIDHIETIYSEATSLGLEIRSFHDLKSNRIRHELYQDKKLVAVEQFEDGSGWQWMKGKITSLEQDRIEEIIYSRYIGLLGLQSSKKDYFLDATVEAASHGYNVTFRVGEYQFIYIVDRNFKLLGDAYKIGQIEQANEYRNFRKIGALQIPFTEESYRDDQKNVVTYSRYIVNEPLKTKWNKP